jgi:hypothetical protein
MAHAQYNIFPSTEAMNLQTQANFYLKMRELEHNAEKARSDRQFRLFLFWGPCLPTLILGYFLWTRRLAQEIATNITDSDRGNDINASYNSINKAINNIKNQLDREINSTSTTGWFGWFGRFEFYLKSLGYLFISFVQILFQICFQIAENSSLYIETIFIFAIVLFGISVGCFFLAIGMIASNVRGVGVGMVRLNIA